MKNAKLQQILKPIAFVGILLFILSLLGQFLYPRDNESDPSMKSFEARKIFAEERNTIDVIALGHSRVYTGFSPMEMYGERGITAYACSEPLQTPWEAYFLLKDVYKNQKPQLIIYETDQLFYNDTVKSVNSAVASMFTRTFPVIEYHNNWKKLSLKTSPQKKDRRATKGYRYFEGARGMEYYPLEPSNKKEKLSAMSLSFFKKIVKLAQKNQSEILLIAMPARSSWNMARHNTVSELAEKFKLNFIDLNEPVIEKEVGINWLTDTRDLGDHLNHKGAVKVSKYFANYLADNYNIEDKREQERCSYWKTDYKKYLELTKEKEE